MNRLRELRELNKLSMKELGEKIGVSDAAICKWENGSHEPKSSYIIKLADYFNCTTDYLLGRENYSTGNIEIIGEQLTNEEEKVVEAFRVLNSDGKIAFLSMAKNLSILYMK